MLYNEEITTLTNEISSSFVIDSDKISLLVSFLVNKNDFISDMAFDVLKIITDLQMKQSLFYALNCVSPSIMLMNFNFKKLMAYVSTPQLAKFVNDISYLQDPGLEFCDWITRVSKINVEDFEALNMEYQNLNYRLLEPSGESQIRVSFASAFARHIQTNLIGKNLAKLISSLKNGNFKKLFTNFYKEKILGKFEDNLIENYSTWLSDYKNVQKTHPLFIQGHLLSGFHPFMVPMQSLRKPKKITIFTAEEREIDFLVKAGEDLRLDDHLQKTFKLMNAISYSQRKHQIHCYSVFPFSNNVGILQWVPSCVSFRSIIEDQFIFQFKGLKEMEESTQLHSKWVQSYGGWSKMLAKASEVECISIFNRLKNLIPTNLLRNYMMRMVALPENFLKLRIAFSKSYSALIVAHYILGVGDRHLDNILLQTTT